MTLRRPGGLTLDGGGAIAAIRPLPVSGRGRDAARPPDTDARTTRMSRRCELTGKSPMVGNNVSHANNKTKRRFLPNLNEVSLTSETLGQTLSLRISAAALRSVDHRGGLDAFLAKAPDAELSAKALKLKREIAKAQSRGLTPAGPHASCLSGLDRPGAGAFSCRGRVARRAGPETGAPGPLKSYRAVDYGYDLTKF